MTSTLYYFFWTVCTPASNYSHTFLHILIIILYTPLCTIWRMVDTLYFQSTSESLRMITNVDDKKVLSGPKVRMYSQCVVFGFCKQHILCNHGNSRSHCCSCTWHTLVIMQVLCKWYAVNTQCVFYIILHMLWAANEFHKSSNVSGTKVPSGMYLISTSDQRSGAHPTTNI